jgi:hypothetical protein
VNVSPITSGAASDPERAELCAAADAGKPTTASQASSAMAGTERRFISVICGYISAICGLSDP